MTLRKEVMPKFFHYLRMAHLYNHITSPVKHTVIKRFVKKMSRHIRCMLSTMVAQRSYRMLVFCIWVYYITYVCVCFHLSAKDDRSPSMSSSGTKSFSLSEFLFQTKASDRPRAAPSLRILCTRYCPEAHTHTNTHDG